MWVGRRRHGRSRERKSRWHGSQRDGGMARAFSSGENRALHRLHYRASCDTRAIFPCLLLASLYRARSKLFPSVLAVFTLILILLPCKGSATASDDPGVAITSFTFRVHRVTLPPRVRGDSAAPLRAGFNH